MSKLPPRRDWAWIAHSGPHQIIVACDNDGVLSPFVDDPLAARPLPEAVAALRRLVAVGVRVAIVSGRRAEYLEDRYGPSAESRMTYIGMAGAEIISPSYSWTAPLAREMVPAIRKLVERASAILAPKGIAIEDKVVSLVLHHRTAPELIPLALSFAAESAIAYPNLTVSHNTAVTEIMPDFKIDKGIALMELIRRVGGITSVIYLGDDPANDEVVADTLHGQDDVSSVIVTVAHGQLEQRSLVAKSDFTVPDAAGAARVLNEVADHLELTSS